MNFLIAIYEEGHLVKSSAKSFNSDHLFQWRSCFNVSLYIDAYGKLVTLPGGHIFRRIKFFLAIL